MAADAASPLAGGGSGGQRAAVPTVSVPEVRDYQKINAELIVHLDAGHRRVRLAGAEGQRLLTAGLTGNWEAVVEVEGRAGPELAAEVNAPNLIIVARGPAADGAGRGLRGGRLVILGSVGAAVGYAQSGGAIVVEGDAGPRAGLNQSGGVLVLLGRVGPLAGERQSGGRLFAAGHALGPHSGRGRRGGRLVTFSSRGTLFAGLNASDAASLYTALARVSTWLSPVRPA